MSTTRRPGRLPAASRRAVIAVFVALPAALLALLWFVGLLRHPDSGGPEPDRAASDPRVEIECPGASTREGVERSDPVPPAELPPVEVTSGGLLDCPEHYDGRHVIFRGEVVGEPLGRGALRWIQVNDDAYSGEIGPLPSHRFYLGGNSGIGVRAPAEQVGRIRWLGGPTARGDRVEIRGVFRRYDPASTELAIIRADQVVVLAPGGPLERPVPGDRRIVAYVLTALAVAVVLVERRRARNL